MCPWLFTRMRKWEMVTGLTVGECRGERCTGITRTTTAGVAHRCRQASSMQTHNERNHRDAYQFISSLPVKYLSVCKPFDWNERISLNKSLLTSTFRISHTHRLSHTHASTQLLPAHRHTHTHTNQIKQKSISWDKVSWAFRFIRFSLFDPTFAFFSSSSSSFVLFRSFIWWKVSFPMKFDGILRKTCEQKSESRHATTATIACTHCLSSACFHRLISARKIDVRTF